jgi:PEP-CTERM motif
MRIQSIGTVAAALYLLAASATGATADPIQVTGFYSTQPSHTTISSAQLTLTFPGFAVSISDNNPAAPSPLALTPGFDVGNHSPVPFTQSTGTFSLHSVASPGLGIVGADVTGHLSFVGPTVTVNLNPLDCVGQSEPDCEVGFIEPITWSAVLSIRDGSHVFFSGSLRGSGTGFANFGTFPPGQFWNGTGYSLSGVADTPEPASILLLGSGAAWLAGRRRRGAR